MPGYSFGKDLTADSDDDGGASRRSGAGPSRRTDAGASARPGGGDFTHLDAEGHARMVDVGEKPVTARAATASAVVRTTPAVVAAIRDRSVPKGDVLAVARIAGIQGAKRTSELIPLCHPLALEAVDVELALEDAAVRITATARLHGRTGVEMEALTAAAVAALAVYDMCKALDRGMVIEDVRLERKSGGRSGDWERPRA